MASKFQHRHYEEIARTIREIDSSDGRADSYTMARVVFELSRTFRADNPRFDETRFTKAALGELPWETS